MISRAAPSSTLRPSSTCAVMPDSLIALSCWKRFNERGTVVSRSVAIVASGTSAPAGPVTKMSWSCSGVKRSLRAICGMTL